jgi:hypothetical protein
MTDASSRDDGATTLRLSYESAIQERDRLRAARAFFARQLGPLPAVAGISVGLVAAFSERIHHRGWLWIALGLLAVMVIVSLVYSGMPAYRHLRARKERDWRAGLEKDFPAAARRAEDAKLSVEDMLAPAEWYAAQIRLERELSGSSKKNRLLRPSWDLDEADLADQLDRERTGVFATQFLFLLVIGCLLAARL